MRASTISAILVGATLSVAPIFSLVWAQQSNQQASLLMEMQALRGEIAELRDMVERQDHQLRQMQKAAQARRPVRPSNSAGNQANNAVVELPAATRDSSVQDTISAGQNTGPGISPDAQASNQDGEPATSEYPATQPPSTSTSMPPANTVDADEEEVAPAFADQDTEFYQAYPVVDSASNGSGAPTVNRPDVDGQSVDGVLIEDRVIGPRPAQSVPQSQSSFPPVEDRQVGEPVYQAPPNPQPQVISPVETDRGAATNSGVIAVPASTAPINGQVYTLPPQIVAAVPGGQNVVMPGQGAPVQTGSAQGTPQGTPIEANPTLTSAQVASAAVPAAGAAIATVLSEQDYYQQGFELLKQSKHVQAVKVFKQQISNYPQGDFADDAHYWIAESMYVNRDLENSKGYFKAIIDGFAQSPRLPDAMLKTAYIEQEQGNQIEARILLQEIIQYHPRSNAAISAKNRLAEIN